MTMTKLQQLLADLKRLEALSSKSKWRVTSGNKPHSKMISLDSGTWIARLTDGLPDANGELICQMQNNLPLLVSLLEFAVVAESVGGVGRSGNEYSSRTPEQKAWEKFYTKVN